MKNKKIFICGNFGYYNNQIGGQVIRTRTIKDTIIKKIDSKNVLYVDTSYIKTNPLSIFRRMKRYFIKSSHIIILPGIKGIRILLPLFIIWKKQFNKDVRYIVIGGWLPDFLKKSIFYLYLCKKLDGIYVQTEQMKKRLVAMGLKNVYVFPNFRQTDYIVRKIHEIEKPFKLVYFSEVNKTKGIELAILAVKKINKNKENILAKLDIYGPIAKNYNDNFKKILGKCENYISYRGIIEHIENDIYDNLSNYDLLLFPTYHEGEGFPGVILESFIAGVPVLASDWKYNSEVIKENETGKLFISQDIKDLVKKLDFIINNPDLIYEMKKKCLIEANKYRADLVINILLDNMY